MFGAPACHPPSVLHRVPRMRSSMCSVICRWLAENEHLAKAADDPSQLDPDAAISGGLLLQFSLNRAGLLDMQGCAACDTRAVLRGTAVSHPPAAPLAGPCTLVPASACPLPRSLPSSLAVLHHAADAPAFWGHCHPSCECELALPC